MDTTIRKMKEDDFPQVFTLIQELAEHLGFPDHVDTSVQQLKNEKDTFSGLVVEIPNGDIVGYAIYSVVFYTWSGKKLFLDDLYVKEEHRGKGVGRKLLNSVFDQAKEKNCHGVNWQVLKTNEKAIEFYKKIGSKFDDDCIDCSISVNKIEDIS